MFSLSHEFLNSHEDGIFLFSLCEASIGKIDLEAESKCASVSSLTFYELPGRKRTYLISSEKTLLMNISYRKAMSDPKILPQQKSMEYVYFQ